MNDISKELNVKIMIKVLLSSIRGLKIVNLNKKIDKNYIQNFDFTNKTKQIKTFKCCIFEVQNTEYRV